MKNPNLERGVFKQPRGENRGKNKNPNNRQQGTAVGKNNNKGIAAIMDNVIWFKSNCRCHGHRHLTIPIVVVHDSGITHYFANYFALQINFIIFFQLNYFGLKLIKYNISTISCYILSINKVQFKIISPLCTIEDLPNH